MKRLNLLTVWSVGTIAVAMCVSLSGCGSGLGAVGGGDAASGGSGTTDQVDQGDKVDDAGKRVYESPGGTAGLNVAADDSGAAVLTSFDPGAFVRTVQDTSTAGDDTLDPAQFDGGGEPPPPPPDDGGGSPPPDDGGGAPPPDDGTAPPPDDGTNPPPDDGTMPPDDGTMPPDDGTMPPDDGTMPPDDGTMPPDDGTMPPDDGTMPPDDGTMPPPPDDGTMPPDDGFFPPPPDGEGGEFTEGFMDGEGPPPPPPPEGFEDDFQEFLADSFGGVDFEVIPGDFFAEGAVDETGELVPFEDFPFDELLQEVPLDVLFTDAPPEFEPGVFGEFEFGEVPPPPEDFPEFPPPPEFMGEAGEFNFHFDFGAEGDGVPPPPPPDMFPEEFFTFDASVDDLHEFLQGFEFFPPPPGPDEGGEGPFMPDQPQDLAFIDFDEVADLLPETFLPPDEVVEQFAEFGADHPLISDEGTVNPDLELAFFERPPVPTGFDGFDFAGDVQQFDDLFTHYDTQSVGETVRGQVNAAFSAVLEDGTVAHCSDTTVLEAVHGEATPLVVMEPGLFQTQWVVNVRQLTSSRVSIEDPDNPEEVSETQLSKETLSQMTWTLLMREVDTDGDGETDEIQVTGSNETEVLNETTEGELPNGTPPLPPPPELVIPFEFDGVLRVQEPETSGQEPDAGVQEPVTSEPS